MLPRAHPAKEPFPEKHSNYKNKIRYKWETSLRLGKEIIMHPKLLKTLNITNITEARKASSELLSTAHHISKLLLAPTSLG